MLTPEYQSVAADRRSVKGLVHPAPPYKAQSKEDSEQIKDLPMTVLYTYASVQVVLNILPFTVDEYSPTWLVSTAHYTALTALAAGRFIYPEGKVCLLATRSCFSDIDMPQAAAFFAPLTMSVST